MGTASEREAEVRLQPGRMFARLRFRDVEDG